MSCHRPNARSFEKATVNGFLDGKEPSALRFFYQVPDSKDGQPVPANTKPQLVLAGPVSTLAVQRYQLLSIEHCC